MSTPSPRKKPTTKLSSGAPGQARKGSGPLKKGRKRKKKKQGWRGLPVMQQVIAGVTLLGAVGGLVAGGLYLVQQSLPKPVAPTAPDKTEVLTRPSIAPSLEEQTPKRPGLTAAMPDEIYYPKASDVAGTPVEPPVQGLLDRGVITVFADGKFRPNLPVGRAQFVSWCYNAVMAQSKPGPDPFIPPARPFVTIDATGEEFGDVSTDHWAAGVLATLKKSGVLGSDLPNYFRPDAPMTRAEWLVFAADFGVKADLKAQALKAPVDEQKLQAAYRHADYTDYEALKPYLKPYVWLVFGDDKRREWLPGTFGEQTNPGPWHPEAVVTRGEAASWIGAAYDQIGKEIF